MSRTKARVIASLRMRRCSQRRNRTNCTPAAKRAVKTPYQWVSMEFLLECGGLPPLFLRSWRMVANKPALPCKLEPQKWFRPRLKEKREQAPALQKLEKCAGQSAERGAQAGAERGEESAAVAARSVCARIQQFRGDTERAAEEIGVYAEEAGEALQRGHLPLKGGVGEGQLILLGLAGLRNSLLARKLVGELAESGRVARARQAVLRGLLERIEGAG